MSTDTPNPARAAARTYFIRLIWAVLLLSVAGNAVHAIPGISDAASVRVMVAILPPLLLAAMVHGLGHLAGAGVVGRLYTAGVVFVALIAAAAGAASFVALRDLAAAAGWSPMMAWLLPVIIDLPVPIATAVVVAVDRAAMTDGPSGAMEHGAPLAAALVHRDPEDGAPAMVHHDDAPDGGGAPAVVHQDSQDTTADATADLDDAAAVRRDAAADHGDAVHLASPVPATVHHDRPVTHAPPRRTAPTAVHHDAPAAHGAPADGTRVERVIAMTRTTAPPATVAAILDLLDAGESARAIAAEIGVSTSMAQRITRAARDLDAAPALAG